MLFERLKFACSFHWKRILDISSQNFHILSKFLAYLNESLKFYLRMINILHTIGYIMNNAISEPCCNFFFFNLNLNRNSDEHIRVKAMLVRKIFVIIVIVFLGIFGHLSFDKYLLLVEYICCIQSPQGLQHY